MKDEINFYELLEIDPEATRADITMALETKAQLWKENRLATDALPNQNLIPEIRKVMVDGFGSGRQQEMKNQLIDRRRRVKEGKEDAIRHSANEGRIPLKALEGLADSSFKVAELQEMAESLGFSVIKDNVDLSDRRFERIAKLLSDLGEGHKDLYEFLKVKRRGANQEEMERAAQDQFEMGRVQGGPKGPMVRELGIEGINISRDKTKKLQYNKWLKKQSDEQNIQPLFDRAKLLTGKDRLLNVNVMRDLLQTSYALTLTIDPQAVEKLLKDKGYQVSGYFPCPKCEAPNNFYQGACTGCGNPLDGKRVVCPDGHENPNLTRYCIGLTGGCRKKIAYKKQSAH